MRILLMSGVHLLLGKVSAQLIGASLSEPRIKGTKVREIYVRMYIMLYGTSSHVTYVVA